jgi:hypothetical protein
MDEGFVFGRFLLEGAAKAEADTACQSLVWYSWSIPRYGRRSWQTYCVYGSSVLADASSASLSLSALDLKG